MGSTDLLILENHLQVPVSNVPPCQEALKSATHKIGSGSHLFRFTEIVHAFWHRNICPTFSRLYFVGAQFSINFTLVRTLIDNHWIHWGKRSSCCYRVFLYLSWITQFSLFTYHQHKISQAGCTISAAWYLSTYLQEKGIPWAALDSGLRPRLAGPRGCSHYTEPQYKAQLLSSIWVDAWFIFRGKFLAWILHFNAMH